MTKITRLLCLTLLPAFLISACSSGVTQSKAGGAGTNTGSTGLLVFGTVEPNPTVSNAFVDCTPAPTPAVPGPATPRGDGIADTVRQPIVGELTATVQDPRGIYAFPFQPQGVTYDSYSIRYTPITAGSTPLSPRNFQAITITIPLQGVTTPVSVTDSIILMDLETLKQFEGRDSGSPNTYALTITYRGRDFIKGEPITMVINHQVQVGGFCSGFELPP